MQDRAASEFDPDLVTAFVRMMRQWEPQVAGDDRRASPRARGRWGRGGRDLSGPLSGYISFVMSPIRSAAMRRSAGMLVLLLGIAPALAAQSADPGPVRRARLEGKWQAKTDEEIRNIMVRSDSSAQFGDQVARWRMVGDSLWLTLGDGVWQVYGMKLGSDKLTLSGGDLEKPVTLRRAGPATARADSVAIPAPPLPTERAWD